MRQPVRRGVAPLNTNPKWPEGYVAVLREAGAQEKTIPFFVTWVRRFFARFPGRSRRSLGRVEIETFLSEMARRNEISNWGVAQARDALELYYEQFRGIALEPRPDSPKGYAATSPDDVSPSLPSPTSARPSLEHAKPIAARSQPVRAPTVKPPEPYQAQRAPVKAVAPARPSAVARENTAGSSVPATVGPTPGAGPGKTNWPVLKARVREYLRVGHYSYRTEQTYLGWIRQFVVFHQGRKPSTMEAGHVRDFLRYLAMERQVASSTQNQALNAVVFLFKAVLKKEIGDFSDFQRARRGFRLPVVASREEIKGVLDRMAGRERFMGALLYGTGMRINELLRLRVQDVQFDQKCLLVRGGKGDKDRYVPFPTKYR